MGLTHEDRKRIQRARSDARRTYLRTCGRVDLELRDIVARVHRCQAETRSGRPCPFSAESGELFCGVHAGHARRWGTELVTRSDAR